MRKNINITLLLIVALLLSSTGLFAQGSEEQQNSAPEGPQPVSSISHPRSGVSLERSFIVPKLSFYQVYDSKPQLGVSPVDGYDIFSHVNGSLALQRLHRTRTFTATYNGGLIMSNRTRETAHFHEAALTQEFTGRRTSLVLSNTFRYTPASEFGLNGFGGFGGINVPGLGALRSDLRPNQGLLTTPSSQFSNAVGGEVTYLAGARSSITFSGSYGLLRFTESGFFDVDQIGYAAGYNRQVSARNTLSLSYSGQFIDVTGGTEILSHAVHAGFGRQISNRVRFQVSGGPQISRFEFAVPGVDRTHVGSSVNASLTYLMPRSTLTGTYSRGVTGGSGVLEGGHSDAVDLSAGRQITRMWSAHGSFGYVRTAGLSGSAQSGTAWHAVVGGGGISRPLGRQYDMFINYRWYRQITTVPGLDQMRHTVSVGFSWNPTSIRLGN